MNVLRREQKIHYVVKTFEKCRPLPASKLVSTLKARRIGIDTCVLCLCGESLLPLTDTISLKDEQADTPIIMKTLVDELCVIPAVPLDNSQNSPQKICKTCVNKLSSFYQFTNKCSKTARTLRNVEKYVFAPHRGTSDVNQRCEDIYKCGTDANFIFRLEETRPKLPPGICKIKSDIDKTFTCDICSEQNMSEYNLYEHKRLHTVESLIQNVAYNKPMCICCLKQSENTVNVSEDIIFKQSNAFMSSQAIKITLNQMISEMFNISIEEANDEALICESCIEQTKKSYSFKHMIKQSIAVMNRFADTFAQSLSKVTVDNTNFFETTGARIYIDYDNVVKKSGDVNGMAIKIDRNFDNNTETDNDGIYSYEDEERTSRKRARSGNKIKRKVLVCDYCNKMFYLKSAIQAHIEKHMSNEILPEHTLLCDVCDEGCESKELLILHKTTSHKRTCTICNRVAIGRMEKHVDACQKSFKPFKCDICNARFKNEFFMNSHRGRHFLKSFACELCWKIFRRKSELDVHHTTFHKEEVLRKKAKYRCTMCPLDFISHRRLVAHKAFHPIGSKHNCRICQKSFDDKKDYFLHIGKHINRKCTVCGKSFSKNNINRHMKTHASGGQEPVLVDEPIEVEEPDVVIDETSSSTMCDLCGVVLSCKAVLLKHKESHIERAQCPHCFKFVKHKNLEWHIEGHKILGPKKRRRQKRNYKLTKCDECDYSTLYPVCMEAHKNRHLGVRPFKCHLCEKGFFSKITLTQHVVTHAGLKPEQCEQCGNRFACKKSLLLHIRLHTGEKPYKCDMCDERFTNSSRRQTHRLRKHLGPNAPCPLCSKLYYTQSAVRKHIRQYHNREPGKKRSQR